MAQNPPAARRNRPSYTPGDLLSATLNAPLHWPGRTIRLQRDSLLDYTNRSTSALVSIAELYHENSKLSPQLLPELACTAVDVDALRREFLRRRIARASATAPAIPLEPWSSLADEVFAAVPQLFYAIELRIVVGGAVFGYEPGGGLSKISQLTSASQRDFFSALHLFAEDDEEPAGAVAVLLGCFARNDILLGSRGYRRTLLEAGQLAHEVIRIAAQQGHAVRLRLEFADRELDLVMESDGVEQSAVAAVEIG